LGFFRRLAEQIALAFGAAPAVEKIEFGLLLDAFGRAAYAKAARQAKDRIDDEAALVIVLERSDEAAVDRELVELARARTVNTSER
jgi:hypothetical protein